MKLHCRRSMPLLACVLRTTVKGTRTRTTDTTAEQLCRTSERPIHFSLKTPHRRPNKARHNDQQQNRSPAYPRQEQQRHT